jgi:hypothetical protein
VGAVGASTRGTGGACGARARRDGRRLGGRRLLGAQRRDELVVARRAQVGAGAQQQAAGTEQQAAEQPACGASRRQAGMRDGVSWRSPQR